MLLSVWCILTNPPILGYCQYSQYTELLIGRVALTSFNWWTYWVVRVGAYSLNNLRIEIRAKFRVSVRFRVRIGVRVWIVWYMDAQTAARSGSTDPY